jgi:hypothetical protein
LQPVKARIEMIEMIEKGAVESFESKDGNIWQH